MANSSIFIGSSREGQRIASQVQHDLKSVGRPTIWNQGVFGLGWGTLETLMSELSRHDFAVLVLSPDDRTTSREIEHNSPRDNVTFELGLFMGRLGRERTFVLYDASANMKLLSDLAGITLAPYDGEWAKENLAAAIGAACHPIREAILSVGHGHEDIRGDWIGTWKDLEVADQEYSKELVHIREQIGDRVSGHIDMEADRGKRWNIEGVLTHNRFLRLFYSPSESSPEKGWTDLGCYCFVKQSDGKRFKGYSIGFDWERDGMTASTHELVRATEID
jgi:hypothetical protein